MLTGAPATAATETWTVPRSATITIKGHGYGHGHGMSQHGAQGAALQGLTAAQIVGFYYPGTKTGTSGGPVRVHISSDTSPDVEVRSRAKLFVHDVATGDRIDLPDNGAESWRLNPKDGKLNLSFRTDRWRFFRRITGVAEFNRGGGPITLVTPSGDRAFRGRLRATGGDTVNVLNLDQYLKGVVPLEMPALWEPAAVQAQAIAARTYASYERAHPRADHYQICDTTSCQVYGGYDAEHPATNAAIKATAGQVRTYAGQPAFTQFSASSGGWTSAGSVPYLVAQEDPYDGWSGNAVHDWTVRITDRRIESLWPSLGNLKKIEVISRDGNGQWGGRVGSLVLHGGKDTVEVSGDTVRTRLGLRSTWFTFRVVAR